MATAARKKRPPTFSTFVEIEVDVDPEELERAGWKYVGKPDGDGLPERTVLDVIERWHYDNHADPWRFCTLSPCDELRGRTPDGRN